VPEKFLDNSNIGSATKQVSGKGVPKSVGRDRGGEVCSLRGGSDQQEDVLATERRASGAQKQGGRPPPFSQQRRTATNQICGKRLTRETPHRDDSLLVAFAGQGDGVEHVISVDIVDHESDRF
jgi:hypothetical protein